MIDLSVFHEEELRLYNMLVGTGISEEDAYRTLVDDKTLYKDKEAQWLEVQERKTGIMKIRARGPDAYKGIQPIRPHKPNYTRQEIIQTIFEGLEELPDSIMIIEPEKRIDFWLDGERYTVTLTHHKKEK